MSDESEFFCPEAWYGDVSAEDEREPDPYFRPDAVPEEDGETDAETGLEADFLPELPTEPCPCCGADIPENPSWGYICPVCRWEIDYDVEGDPDAPSDQNNGLSLTEAQMNFRAFGISDPFLLQQE